MIPITIAAFVILLILGVPVAFAVGMAGFLGLWWSGAYPLAIIIQQIFLTADSFVLLAIPLFILAGALMETGGIARRLVPVAPDSAIGILVPPCILIIIIGAIADVSVAALFAGGFIPALVLGLVIMAYIYVQARRSGMAAAQKPSVRELGRASIDALIPMGLPIIIFGGILGGGFTPTEAAGVAVLYAAIVGLFIYREISWSALPGILIQSAVITANVCFLLGTAAGVAWVLAVAQVPAFLAETLRSFSAGPTAFLLFSAGLFIFLGAVIEGPAAVVN